MLTSGHGRPAPIPASPTSEQRRRLLIARLSQRDRPAPAGRCRKRREAGPLTRAKTLMLRPANSWKGDYDKLTSIASDRA
jgi:hypothetical protein